MLLMPRSKDKPLLVAICAVFILGGIYYFTHSGKGPVAQPQQIVSAAQVPEGGWYSHTVSGIDSSIIILTKTKDLPAANPNNYVYGENIEIAQSTIGIPPEEYVKQTLNLPDNEIQSAFWTTLNGRREFSVSYTRDGSGQQRDYLFGGDQVVTLTLNPTTPQNDGALQQVENYYSQTMPMISRAETQANCALTGIPIDSDEYSVAQTYDLQIGGNGYVTLGYPRGSKDEKYIFLNFNDDLSKCSPDLRNILTEIDSRITPPPHPMQ